MQLCLGAHLLTFRVQQLAASAHVYQEEAIGQGGLTQPRFTWGPREQVKPGVAVPAQGGITRLGKMSQ